MLEQTPSYQSPNREVGGSTVVEEHAVHQRLRCTPTTARRDEIERTAISTADAQTRWPVGENCALWPGQSITTRTCLVWRFTTAIRRRPVRP